MPEAKDSGNGVSGEKIPTPSSRPTSATTTSRPNSASGSGSRPNTPGGMVIDIDAVNKNEEKKAEEDGPAEIILGKNEELMHAQVSDIFFTGRGGYGHEHRHEVGDRDRDHQDRDHQDRDNPPLPPPRTETATVSYSERLKPPCDGVAGRFSDSPLFILFRRKLNIVLN